MADWCRPGNTRRKSFRKLLYPTLSSVPFKGDKCSKSSNVGDGDVATVETTENAIFLEIPVMAGYRLNIAENFNLTFNAGPYFALAWEENPSWEWIVAYGAARLEEAMKSIHSTP